ncbi:MAG: hypothetical protein QXX55_01860 [Candidatus Pacearchaeota archaeon]
MIDKKNKKAQEEIVGFVIIIIFVAVIMLFILLFYLKSPQKESVESYEVNSFLSSILLYTTDCENYYGPMNIQEVIFECARNQNSLCVNNEQNSCQLLESTLTSLTSESWPIGENQPIKGYEFRIVSNGAEILFFSNGNLSGSYKGAIQDFAKGSDFMNISFKVYYNN